MGVRSTGEDPAVLWNRARLPVLPKSLERVSVKSLAAVVRGHDHAHTQGSELIQVVEEPSRRRAVDEGHVARLERRPEAASEGLLDRHKEGRRPDPACEHDGVSVAVEVGPTVPERAGRTDDRPLFELSERARPAPHDLDQELQLVPILAIDREGPGDRRKARDLGAQHEEPGRTQGRKRGVCAHAEDRAVVTAGLH